jgi:mediator of RNA polymerase II transcription subunit 14
MTIRVSARVAYTKVEQQLKLRGIPYTHVNPPAGNSPSELAHFQSPLAHSVPALCVQASHILSGVPAAEAAMSNIRVVPLNWWSDKKAQVCLMVGQSELTRDLTNVGYV